MLTTKALLDDILTRIPDNSAAMRGKCLVWINEAMAKLANHPRQWEFLRRKVSLAISGGAVTLPDDFGRVMCVSVGSTFFDASNELTDEEAFLSTQYGNPVGYTLDAGTLTFYPAMVGTAQLAYLATVTAPYADDTTPTIFPDECGAVLKRSVLTVAYEVDKDQSVAASLTLDDMELADLKRLDNRRKPVPKRNRRGYLVTR